MENEAQPGQNGQKQVATPRRGEVDQKEEKKNVDIFSRHLPLQAVRPAAQEEQDDSYDAALNKYSKERAAQVMSFAVNTNLLSWNG